MAGSREGLYEFRNGQFVKAWNDQNSPIESFNKKSKDYELVYGVMYDKEGNLWVLNSQAHTVDSGIHKRRRVEVFSS